MQIYLINNIFQLESKKQCSKRLQFFLVLKYLTFFNSMSLKFSIFNNFFSPHSLLFIPNLIKSFFSFKRLQLIPILNNLEKKLNIFKFNPQTLFFLNASSLSLTPIVKINFLLAFSLFQNKNKVFFQNKFFLIMNRLPSYVESSLFFVLN
jgi:hypothetical protein